MKKYKIGYTQGVYDLFHIGHLNLLNNAKKQCDYLVVGINSDRLVEEYKNKKPVISENDRATIVANIKCVDKVIIVDTLDKLETHNIIKFDAIFIGSDWKGNERWQDTEKQLKKVDAKVVYLDYTNGISSTIIKNKIK
ncbi:adenylyltransferase/cytidyltransferase family protein [bacterium]|nr:adenylyltransferase/cytidyltransferase family protein [bacterium]